MAEQVRVITEADALAMEEIDKLMEVSEGQWDTQTMASPEHGHIGGLLIFYLNSYILPRKLGQVYSADATFVLEGTPDNIITMRLPDVSFVAAERVQKITEGYYYLAPDLAVEIISPSERAGKIKKKHDDYLRTGVKQVWQIFPEDKKIVVYTTDGTSTTYGIDDTISGGAVLPGFTLKVVDLFQE